MDVIRISTSFESQSQFSLWVSRNRSVLAFQAASIFFFITIFLSLRVDFFALSISLFNFNLGRTHMFILCNGIVAILVKGSMLADPHDEAKNVEGLVIKNDEVSAEKSVEMEKKVVSIVVEKEEEEEEEQEKLQEEEDGFEELSVEELNKKCDEFIRKMRGVISNGNVLLL